MSVKLYYGLKLRDPNMSVFDAVNKIAPIIREVAEKESHSIASHGLARAVDHPIDAEGVDDHNLLRYLMNKHDREQGLMGTRDIMHDPLYFSIVFGKAQNGDILVYPFCGHGYGYHTALEDSGLFDEYAYYNNSDPADGITDEQWEERRENWESILDDNDSFGSLPSWSLAEEFSDIYYNMILQHDKVNVNDYVTPDQRLRKVLQTLVTSHSYEGDLGQSPMLYDSYRNAIKSVDYFAENHPDEYKALLPDPLPPFTTLISNLPTPMINTIPIEVITKIMQDNNDNIEN